MLTKLFVENLFKNLEIGKQDIFFSHVADNVVWQVMGTHPLAGIYHSKDDFTAHTFKRLNKILKGGVILRVRHIFIDGNTAIVEMESLSTAHNGKPFNNVYCWVCKFNGDKIIEVRAYLDSALVKQVIDENELDHNTP